MGKSYKHLTLVERALLQTQLVLRWSPSAIAEGLQRARSTITREMARNGWLASPEIALRGRPRVAGGYRAEAAHERASLLSSKPRVARKLVVGSELFLEVVRQLRRGLSPEQIAFTLRTMDEPVRLSHETIYTALYAMPRGQLRARILTLLRRAHQHRRLRSAGKDRGKSIPNMTLIDDRPIEVEERLVPGHWEGDLIKGKRNQSQVGTLVERTTLYVALVKLENGKAETAAEGFAEILNRFDAAMRLSMTYDQGREMAHHEKLSERTGLKVYFAHPHSPWERGRNENTNGLLRQYLPKGEDLSGYSQLQLDQIAASLNARPRKSLGWKAPSELFLPKGAFDFKKHWAPSNTINLVALGA
jgi:IS30 family transposase